MKSLVRHIPNTLTCISLICGFYAAILGISGNYFGAMCSLFLAAIFDFSDGFAARLLKAGSAVGKELDSLADLISFGVAPGMILYSYLDSLSHNLSWSNTAVLSSLSFIAFAIPVLSAVRLAKFNLDERQKTSFIGLPVPAHAILWSSLITVLAADVHTNICLLPQAAECTASIRPEVLFFAASVLAIATSLLLVSGISMFSLKVSSLTWKANKLVYTFLISALILIIFFGIFGITLTMLLYILLSYANHARFLFPMS